MTIGVLGGGQLGRMLAIAGLPLGLNFRFMDPSRDAVAGHAGKLICDDFNDPKHLDAFCAGLDVCTYEFENVPLDLARRVAERCPLRPGLEPLRRSQDRLLEKTLFTELGIPTPAFRPADSLASLTQAVAAVGYPCVVKTRRLGYDGKGQAVIRRPEDVPAAWTDLQRGAAADQPAALIVEAFVHFTRELSVIAARSTTGQTVIYPLNQNTHAGGILRTTLAPAPNTSAELIRRAHALITSLLDSLAYVGVLTVELFDTPDGLLANEMAPRVHNSGHWTIDAARTSQFQNHLRAILGWPLGPTDVSGGGHAAMINLIGAAPPVAEMLAIPHAAVHWYGKQPRAGRKTGHINLSAATAQDRDALLHATLQRVNAGTVMNA